MVVLWLPPFPDDRVVVIGGVMMEGHCTHILMDVVLVVVGLLRRRLLVLAIAQLGTDLDVVVRTM